MEDNRFPGQFKRLEEKIEDLVDTYYGLRQQNSDLETRIYDLENSLKIKMSAEKRHVEEKAVIRSRVESLLGRLDQILDAD